MNLVQVPGFIESTTFNRLGIGEMFDLSRTTPSGPFVKVSRSTYGRLNGAGPTNNNRFQPFGTVTDIIGRVHYFNFPPQTIFNRTAQVVVPRSPALSTYNNIIPSGGAANQGADPVLGPPFAPVFFQLFIDLPDPYATTGGAGSNPARMYWTIPQVNMIVIGEEHLNPFKFRVWFGLVDDITQAHYLDVFHDAPGSNRYVYPSNFMWAEEWLNINTTPPPPPVTAGVAVPGGTNFNGFAIPLFTNPGAFQFVSHVVDSFDHFELRRSRGDSNFSDPTNLGIPNISSVGTTMTAGFTTPSVGSTVDVDAVDSSQVSIGQYVVLQTAGLYLITDINGSTVTCQSVPSSSNVDAGTVITATGLRIAPVQFADDYSARDATTNYFYQLKCVLTNKTILDSVLYNIVGIIRPYTLTATPVYVTIGGVPVYQKSVLTWDAPDPTNWPSTPA